MGNTKIDADFPKSMMALLEEVSVRFGNKPYLTYHHGVHHAIVVVNHALEILSLLKITPSPTVFQEIVIAAFLHEIGMVKTDDRIHGALSRELAADILERLKDQGYFEDLKPESLEVIGTAIFQHDAKEIALSDRSLVSKVVFDADNVDAFGVFGIYRYLAVYKERGWSEQDMILGKKGNVKRHKSLLENLNLRWQQFDLDIKPHYMNDYEITAHFFRNMAQSGSWQSQILGSFMVLPAGSDFENFQEMVGEWQREFDTLDAKETGGATFFDTLRNAFRLNRDTVPWFFSDFPSKDISLLQQLDEIRMALHRIGEGLREQVYASAHRRQSSGFIDR